jgi:hypothetical protein
MIIKRLFFVIVLLPIACIAQIRTPVRSAVQPTVSILHIEPEQPVEGMPMLIYFRFTNNSADGRSLTGWIGGDINSGTGQPGTSTNDWEVTDLANKQSIDGAISVKAPDAGINRLVRIFFYETKNVTGGNITKSLPIYNMGQRNINVAAIITFKLENFIIRHTRARTTDTDWGSLYVSLNDQPAMTPCSYFLGDFENGSFEFNPVKEINIGAIGTGTSKTRFESDPIIVIPGINSIVRTSYFMYNGGSIVNSDEFLKGFANATANPDLFKGPRPGREAWFDLLRVLCPAFTFTGACDGFVVGDSMMIQTNDLFNNTLYGNARFSRRFNSEEFASQIGCGNTSDYEVISSTKRISSATDSYNGNSPVYTSITASHKLNLLSSNISASSITWQRIETIDAGGNFIPVNDPSYGYVTGSIYNAPAQITKPVLVILRGTCTRYWVNGNSYDVFAESQLGHATAIVQLIPGQQKINPAKFNTYESKNTNQY